MAGSCRLGIFLGALLVWEHPDPAPRPAPVRAARPAASPRHGSPTCPSSGPRRPTRWSRSCWAWPSAPTAGILRLATARWVGPRETLLPFAVGVSAIPIIAFAPLINNWFGLDNQLSKAMMAAVLFFFPVMINMARGLVARRAGRARADALVRRHRPAGFRKVRVPNALPFFFTALKVATTLATIGAIIGEYFGAPSHLARPVHRRYAAYLNLERRGRRSSSPPPSASRSTSSSSSPSGWSCPGTRPSVRATRAETAGSLRSQPPEAFADYPASLDCAGVASCAHGGGAPGRTARTGTGRVR